jgi:hypothetical protein
VNRNLGYSLAGAGDVNGDGYGDVIIGVTGYTNGQSYEGFCAVFMGNLQRSRQARTRQYRSDLTTPVQTSNGTFQADCAWGIGQEVWSTMGRARVKLVWEYKGHGPPFQGAPFSNWTGSTGEDVGWTDSGLFGTELKRVLSTVVGTSSHPAWRTRVRHHPATLLDGRVFGRWFYHGLHDDQVPSIKTEYGVCGLLPVELLEQRTTCVGGGVRFDWTTATEHDCAGFVVERSWDALTWESIGALDCAGTSQTPNSYSFHDQETAQATRYYRLKQFDEDGTVALLPVVPALPCVVARSFIHAWPSPVVGMLNVDVARGGDNLEGGLLIALFDATGRCVRSHRFGSDQVISVAMSDLASGTYTAGSPDARCRPS